MNKLALTAVLLAAPLAARADIGLRFGADAAIAYNHNDTTGTHIITDNWPVGADAMLSYWLPTSMVALDAELAEEFALKSGGGNTRIGTVLRPGIRLSPPILPFYVRGAVPINFENNGFDRERFDLRLGAGFTIPLVLFKVFIEADADFPLGGGTGPSTFSAWDVRLNGGLDFRF